VSGLVCRRQSIDSRPALVYAAPIKPVMLSGRSALDLRALPGVLRGMPSSVIRSYFYDRPNRDLHVLFVSGMRYRYAHVPEDVALGLAAASSKGTYFNEYIRDHFVFERIGSARPGDDS
jgi:hypothetical protein